jgi:AcrR family transcriptional regulator
VGRQSRALRTRFAILEAAADVFGERGYEGATITEVYERASMTKGALYFHFRSKEELARAILEVAVTTEGIQPQELKFQEVVDILLVMAYRLPREPMLSAALRLSVDVPSRLLFGTRWPAWSELLAGLVTEARERGEALPYIDAQEVGRTLTSAWTGVRVVTEGLPHEYDLTEEVARLLRMLLPGLVVPAVLARLDVSAKRAESLCEQLPPRGPEDVEGDALELG